MNMPALNLEASGSGQAMNTATQLIAHFHQQSDGLPGARIDPIARMRREAIASFENAGLPNRRVEEWKYTDLRSLMTDAFPPANGLVNIDASEIGKALGPIAKIDAEQLVFVNGYFSETLSSVNGHQSGVELMSLAQALKAPPDWVLAGLGKVNTQADDTIAQLNTALMSDGYVLRLAKGVILERPLHIIHVTFGDMPVSAFLRNLIIAEAESQATILESYIAIGSGAGQTNIVNEIRAGNDTRLRHYKVSGQHCEMQQLSSNFVDLAEKADYLAANFADSYALSRHQTFLRFSGNHARGHYYGAQLLRNAQHCDMTMLIDHDAVGCESRETVKAVLADKARGIFQAKVWVRPDAQQTDGRQMAQSMMLSDEAEFDAKPELEIYADDVKCNHGATSGAIDEDLLFYLQARGINEAEARSLLVRAFIGEIIELFEDEPVREALLDRVAGWLC